MKLAVADTFVVAVPENPEYAREPEKMEKTITRHIAKTLDFTELNPACVN